MPRRRSSRMASTSSLASASVRPPPISSSSSSCGLVGERAREFQPLAVEQAQRLGAPVGEAGHAAERERVDRAVVGRVAARGPPPLVAATKTFSNTVMPANGRGI